MFDEQSLTAMSLIRSSVKVEVDEDEDEDEDDEPRPSKALKAKEFEHWYGCRKLLLQFLVDIACPCDFGTKMAES